MMTNVQLVSLVDRLTALDQRYHRAVAEQARRNTSPPGASDSLSNAPAYMDYPKDPHSWPLADDPLRDAASLGAYDTRPDDSVVLEGRAGESFLSRFSLLSDTPMFDEAVTEINQLNGRSMERLPHNETPDVSIVIPIYGQLAYTLNCLHSLLCHKTKLTFEIIVVDDVSPDQSEYYLSTLSSIHYIKQQYNSGFIASCNSGASAASGKFYVMLNNDTRVVSGWLDALIAGFESWGNAGLVGSKMHYADGSLQEAGGIIWHNATSWNYGRGDDPNRPQYCHARQVDYISGCSIAIPARIWREFDGFDPHFAPAYCEDADLALRLRSAGYEIWYQPASRIVHYEGKTSGTDTSRGVKAYQVVNSRKLYARWFDFLRQHRRDIEGPFQERERAVSRRLLVIDTTTPTPNQDAGSLQTYLALRSAIEAGYKTYFVPEDNFLYQSDFTSQLQSMGVECLYAPYVLDLQDYLRRFGPYLDAVLVYRIGTAEKIVELVRRFAPDAALLFHVADLHYLRMERTAALESSEELAGSAELMKSRELDMVRKADCTITHSTYEEKVLRSELPDCIAKVWPIMTDVAGTKVTRLERKDICFLGGYRHPPNVDAMQYFANEVFPLIRAKQPEIQLIMAGSHPPDELTRLAGNGVVLQGFVDDLRDLFDLCRVFVCPLRVGAGVKGKISAAMAYGIPIVTTHIGTEGTIFKNGEHVLIADKPDEFASAALDLYNNEALWNKLSSTGLRHIAEEASTLMGRDVLLDAITSARRQRSGM